MQQRRPGSGCGVSPLFSLILICLALLRITACYGRKIVCPSCWPLGDFFSVGSGAYCYSLLPWILTDPCADLLVDVSGLLYPLAGDVTRRLELCLTGWWLLTSLVVGSLHLGTHANSTDTVRMSGHCNMTGAW